MGRRRVVVGSVQSIRSRLHLPRFAPERFSLIVVDECHHGTAQSYRPSWSIWDPAPGGGGGWRRTSSLRIRLSAHCRCVGLTATAKRTDDEALDQIFGDEPTFEMNIWDGIQKGWLVNVDQKAIEVQALDPDTVKRRRNEAGEMDFAPAEPRGIDERGGSVARGGGYDAAGDW